MENLFALWAEALRFRSQGNIVQAKHMFQQFEEQAIMLGISPQHPITRHILFEADTSSIEEMWQSSAKLVEKSLETYKAEDQMMNYLEALIPLTQVYIYLKQPEKAASYLEQGRKILDRIEQEKQLGATPFSTWEPVIINAKRQQIENLSNQIASLTQSP